MSVIPEGYPAVASAGPGLAPVLCVRPRLREPGWFCVAKESMPCGTALENAGRALWTCSVSPCRHSRMVTERPMFFPAFFHEAGPELHFPEHLLSRPSRHGNNLSVCFYGHSIFFLSPPPTKEENDNSR